MIREYSIDYNDKEGAARETIKMHRETLESFRPLTNKPEELEWEIRLYNFIEQDPHRRLTEYMDARLPENSRGVPIDKREVVRILGWDVP